MAVPKRRTSKSRKNKRRAHDRLAAPPMTHCSHCGQAKLPHSVCPNCGHYAGREVVRIEEQF